jgi:hypothetical protein
MAATPYPEPLRRPPWLVVVDSHQRGIWVLDCMINAGIEVGPVMACSMHGLLIPVSPQAEHNPLTYGLRMSRHLECSDGLHASRGCLARFWMLPPHTDEGVTDAVGYCEVLQAMRRRRPVQRAS